MSNTDSNIPRNWIWLPLEQLGTWHGGGTPSKSKLEFWSNGCIPWVSPKDMKQFVLDQTDDKITKEALEFSSIRILPTNSILVVVRSGILSRTLPVAVNAIPVCTNQDVKSLIPYEFITSKFLAHYLRNQQHQILSDCSKNGTTVASVNFDRFKKHICPLPPLAEQHRIVAKIESLQERSRKARETLSEVGPLLEQFRQSLLAAAFRGDLTADWRAANPDVEPASQLLERLRQERREKWEEWETLKFNARNRKVPKDHFKKYTNIEPFQDTADNCLASLPPTWKWATIEEVSIVGSGKRLPKGSSLVTTNTGYPYIRAGNLKGGTVRGEIMYLQPEDFETISQYRVRTGDCYLTIVGASIGDAGLVPVAFDGANLTENAAKLIPIIDSEFLSIILQAPQFNEQIRVNVLSAAQGKLALAAR